MGTFFESLKGHQLKSEILGLDVAIMACYDCHRTDNSTSQPTFGPNFSQPNKKLAAMSRVCWPSFYVGGIVSSPTNAAHCCFKSTEGTDKWKKFL